MEEWGTIITTITIILPFPTNQRLVGGCGAEPTGIRSAGRRMSVSVLVLHVETLVFVNCPLLQHPQLPKLGQAQTEYLSEPGFSPVLTCGVSCATGE